jgi:RND family efflux transporter MFP subunit
MTRKALIASLGLALSTALAACSQLGADRTAADPPAGRPPVAVEMARAEMSDITDAVDVVGSLAPKFQAEVKSEYSGIVTRVHVTEWVRVGKGAPLARLDSREVTTALEAARAALLQAQVNETRAVRELERARNLKEYGLVTQQGLDDAASAREAAAAATAAARAQVEAVQTRLEKTTIRAPFDGVVAFRGVNVGDRVENMGGNQPMFRIVDPRVLELTVTLPSGRLSAVRVGQPLEFAVDVMPGRTFAGKVHFINPTVDAVSRSGRVVADVPNPTGELRGGLFVKGRIVTGRRSGVLLVPRAALAAWNVEGGSGAVFVVQGDVARRRSVRTGVVAGDEVEILDGLAANEEVVTRGGFNLQDGDRVRRSAPQAGGEA